MNHIHHFPMKHINTQGIKITPGITAAPAENLYFPGCLPKKRGHQNTFATSWHATISYFQHKTKTITITYPDIVNGQEVSGGTS